MDFCIPCYNFTGMKTIIITGVSGNLGRAVSKKFLAEGYRVIGTLLPKDPAGLFIPHEHFETATANLTEEESAGQFVSAVISRNGTIDAAVLTVGGFAMGSIAETGAADISQQLQLNFETAYNMARPVFLQMMKQKSGRIFLIGSKPGLDMRNSKGMVAYGLAKSLLFRLAELMNEEAKGTNVVTSVVVPSTIDTPQNRKSMPDADPSTWVSADTIANIIYFYCKDEAAALREPVIKVYNNS
jgi:NAD(P)-dependent dehydrogenase (short-subunit alcohol dehydrogenase family)